MRHIPHFLLCIFLVFSLFSCDQAPKLNDETKAMFISASDFEETGLKIHPSIRKSWSYWEAERESYAEVGAEHALISPEGGAGTLASVVAIVHKEADVSQAYAGLQMYYSASFSRKGIVTQARKNPFNWGSEMAFYDLFRGETPSGHLFIARNGRKLYLFLAMEISVKDGTWADLLEKKLRLLDKWKN